MRRRARSNGKKRLKKCKIALKYHLAKDTENITFTVRGKACRFERIKKENSAFSPNAGKTVPDGDVIIFSVEIDVTKKRENKVLFVRENNPLQGNSERCVEVAKREVKREQNTEKRKRDNISALETVRRAIMQKTDGFTKRDIRELCPALSIGSIKGNS